jgi:hypothetical protein
MQPVFQLRWVENPSEMSILKDLNIKVFLSYRYSPSFIASKIIGYLNLTLIKTMCIGESLFRLYGSCMAFKNKHYEH